MHGHRQLHLWVSDHDYSRLRELAREHRESLSAIIRRLIKVHRATPVGLAAPAMTAAIAPSPLTDPAVGE